MPGLEAQIEETAGSTTFVAMGARFTNSTGTPLVSADANENGEAIADVYTLTFTSVIAGTSATVTVSAESPNNPYDGRVKTGVLLDDTTVYDDIIGGVDLVFDNSGSFTGSWAAEVRVGHPFGAFNAFPPDAGTPSGSRQIQVENTGADDAQNCVARLIPVVKRYRITNHVFERLRPFAESAVEKLSGLQIAPYVITVSGVLGSGASKTMDFRVDGSAVDVINLTDQSTGTSDDLNVVDFYRITSGNLEDVEFKLSQDAVSSNEENLLVFEHRFSQIAADVAGTPGSFGTADIDLTESGEATGTITPAGTALFWVRVLVPDGGNAESNPYQCDVALEGSVSGSAGWSS